MRNIRKNLADKLYSFKKALYIPIALAGLGISSVAYSSAKAEEPVERTYEVERFESEESLTKSDIRFPDEYVKKEGEGGQLENHWAVKNGQLELYDYERTSGDLRYLFNNELYSIKQRDLSIKVTINRKEWNSSADRMGIIFSGDPVSGNGGTYYEFILYAKEGEDGRFQIDRKSPGLSETFLGSWDLVSLEAITEDFVKNLFFKGGTNTIEIRYNKLNETFTDRFHKPVTPGWNIFVNEKKINTTYIDIDDKRCQNDPKDCPIDPTKCKKLDETTYSCDRTCGALTSCPETKCQADPETGEVLPETCEPIDKRSCSIDYSICPTRLYDLLNDNLPTGLEGYIGVTAFDSGSLLDEEGNYIPITTFIDEFVIQRDDPLSVGGEGGRLEENLLGKGAGNPQLQPHIPNVFLRGDTNMDEKIDLTDAIHTLQYLYLGGSLQCPDAADANDDESLDISDPVKIILHLFAGQTLPPPNIGGMGMDLTRSTTDNNLPECQGYEFSWDNL